MVTIVHQVRIDRVQAHISVSELRVEWKQLESDHVAHVVSKDIIQPYVQGILIEVMM
jgi:hypothetical protein